MKKALKIFLLSLAGLFVLVMAAVHIVLSPKVLTRIVSKIAVEYVDGNAEIGSIKASIVKNFPNLRLDINDVAVTYPHDKYSQYDSVAVYSPILDAGRGSETDTLASFDRFSGSIDVLALLKGKIHVPHAELSGMRAFAHYYDSTAANWNVILIPESSDTTSTGMPEIALGKVRICDSPEFFFSDQQDTLFAQMGLQLLEVKGKLQDFDKRKAKDRIGLRIDSLELSGRLPADTVVFGLNHFELFEHRDHIDLDADADATLYTWTFGRLDIPLRLESEFSVDGIGQDVVDIDIENLKAQIAELPLNASGNIKLAGDSTYVDGCAAIEKCRIGDIIDNYLTRILPPLSDFSTDAIIDFSAEAKGWLGGGRLPLIKAALAVPDSHFAYEGVFDGGTFDLDLRAENDEEGKFYADLKDFCFEIPGADLNIVGKVNDVLGDDPAIEVKANACTEFAELVKYLPEDSGIYARGDVDFELSGKMKLSQLSLQKFADASITGHIFSDGLNFSSPADSLYAFLSKPDIRIVTGQNKSGINMKAAIDSVRMNLGEGTYAMGKKLSLIAQNNGHLVDKAGNILPLEATIEAESLNMRGTDSLMIGLRNSSNKLSFTKTTEEQLPHISLTSGNRYIFLRTGDNRITLQSAGFTAHAQQRGSKKEETRRRPSHDSHGHSIADSIRSREFVARDSASLRLDKAIPDFLSEIDFRKKDIDIQLGESLVNLFKKWRPSGNVSINYGSITTPALPLRNSITELKGSFTDDEINLKSLNIKSGESALSAQGSIEGLRELLTGRGRTNYHIDLDLYSKLLNLNELIAAATTGAEAAAAVSSELSDAQYADAIIIDTLANAEVSIDNYSLLVLPANVMAHVNFNADSIRYAAAGLTNFTSRIEMQERCVQLTNMSADASFGGIALDGFYSTKTKKDISAGFNFNLRGITSDKVIEIAPAVDSLVPMLKSFKGKLDCEMAATSQLDTNMNLIIPSINGMVKLNGTGLELEDTGSLRKLAQLLMFKDTKVGHLDDMSISGIVSNNRLEIFPFIMGVDRYTLALKGVQNFDQSFKYHISVIKSPLPFKFGVNLWGNFDDWKYRIGKAQYRNTSIPAFTSELDTLQINLTASIKDIFRKGVDAALKESQEGSRNVERRKGEMGYAIDDEDEDDSLSADEQDELDLYLLNLECEQESQAIEEEIEAMMAEELEEMLRELTSGL